MEKDLLDLANGSGFLFQLRVEDAIRKVPTWPNNWNLVMHEHHWRHPEGGDGYIDVVAGYETVRLVIECKKAADQKWLFLVPKEAPHQERRIRVLQTTHEPNVEARVRWRDFLIQPPSAEAAFCVVRGQDPKTQPMLERVADSVLPATEAIALEELAIDNEQQRDQKCVYIPAVVTAATLHIARFDHRGRRGPGSPGPPPQAPDRLPLPALPDPPLRGEPAMTMVHLVPVDRLRTSLAPLRGYRTNRQADLAPLPLRVAEAGDGHYEVEENL